MIVLSVKNLYKSYKTYKNNLWRIFHYFGFGAKPSSQIDILKNISFEIPAGQTVGIVGQNGAGKSTLLKIISNTLGLSSGKVKVNGKICAILELGMGFLPDLTGRQNVYQTASVFGHSKEEIDQKISYIENFAEIGEYFDRPVRLYSSGMQVRLAFSVATAWIPDILIIDEALSVGDAYFQNKSFLRIKQMRESGTTLLLVSHDFSAIIAVCDRAILLEKGEILKDSNPKEVLDFYNALISQKEGVKINQQQDASGEITTISGNGKAKILDAKILNVTDEEIAKIKVGEKVQFCFRFKAFEDIEDLVFGFLIKTRVGVEVYGTNTFLQKITMNLKAQEEKEIIFEFDMNLGVGVYNATAALHSGKVHTEDNYEWKDNILSFEVLNNVEEFKGIAYLQPAIKIKDI